MEKNKPTDKNKETNKQKKQNGSVNGTKGKTIHYLIVSK